MKYYVGQWLIATQKAVDNASKARTLGKAYKVLAIKGSNVFIENNIGNGNFNESRVDELFTLKSNELWI